MPSWGILVTAMLVPACGGKKGLVATAGVVRLDGEAVSGAVVEFHPETPDGRYARGVSESGGNFRLKTDGDDGVAPGTYRVTVTKFELPSKTKKKQSALPSAYASKSATPFQYTIPHDGPIALELHGKAK
jgi:hypothetical protein